MDELYGFAYVQMSRGWLQDYQNLLSAGVIFAGVVLTLWFNAWQARKQRRDELRHQCQSMRTALIAELTSNLEMFDEFDPIRASAKITSADFLLSVDEMDEHYRANIHDLGKLTPDEVKAIIRAYGELISFKAQLVDVGSPVGSSSSIILIDLSHDEFMVEQHKRVSPPIDTAIRAMKNAQDNS